MFAEPDPVLLSDLEGATCKHPPPPPGDGWICGCCWERTLSSITEARRIGNAAESQEQLPGRAHECRCKGVLLAFCDHTHSCY
eukprot:5002863-Amphidinium_carterae.1